MAPRREAKFLKSASKNLKWELDRKYSNRILLQILDAFSGILLGFAGGLALLELRLVLLYLVGAGWMGGWD